MVKKAKIIFLGDTAVGKSCLISAINGHPINTHHLPTIGMDFSTKICHSQKNQQYKLQLWDTAGQQKFRSIMPSYIRNSKIAVLLYDVTAIKSFNNLEKWIEMFQQCASPQSKLIIVGNKIDLYRQRQVTIQKIQTKIHKNNYQYIEISAKTGEGIKQLVQEIVNQLQQMNLPSESNSINKTTTQLGKDRKNRGKCCGK